MGVTSALKESRWSQRTESSRAEQRACGWAGRDARSDEWDGVRAPDMGLALWEKAFPAEGTADAEALRQGHSRVGSKRKEVPVAGAEW